MARTAFLLACLIGLGGCEVMAVSFVGANMATLMHVDKTLPDIALSNQRNKNCSLLHAARNEPYCQSEPPDPSEALAALADRRYCYRTLGAIDCYERPDFLASGHTRVNFATGYLPDRDEPAPLAQRLAPGSPMAGIPAPGGPIPDPPAAAPGGAPASGPADQMAPKQAPAAPAAEPLAKVSAKPQAEPPIKPPGKLPVDPAAPAATGIPLAQVPPLATLPGQGTY